MTRLNKKEVKKEREDKTMNDKNKEVKKENPVKVGDIFHSSWGYDMTINDFYMVTAVLGSRKIKLKQLKNKILNGDGFRGDETFNSSEFKKNAEELTRLVNTNYSTPMVKINSYNTAVKIDSDEDRTYYYNTMD